MHLALVAASVPMWVVGGLVLVGSLDTLAKSIESDREASFTFAKRIGISMAMLGLAGLMCGLPV